MSSEAKFKLEILENLILCRHPQTMRHLKLVYHQSLEINGDWKFFSLKKKNPSLRFKIQQAKRSYYKLNLLFI